MPPPKMFSYGGKNQNFHCLPKSSKTVSYSPITITLVFFTQYINLGANPGFFYISQKFADVSLHWRGGIQVALGGGLDYNEFFTMILRY